MIVNNNHTKTCLTCRGRFDTTLTVCPLDGAMLVEADAKEGSIFDGKYKLIALAGQGGFGVVYKATQLQLERIVAIKILKDLATNDPDCVRRFLREAKAASELVHPNVGAVYAFGVANSGEAYLVMEYLDGRRLCDILALCGPLPLDRALRIMRQVCDAVAAAHRHKIIHRDLKPANIMLVANTNESELVKVVDFGSAKFLGQQSVKSQQFTRPGEMIGTIDYMSPEQCSGGVVDTRSDVYSLGKILNELVNLDGRVPADVRPVIERALQSDPDCRFVDAEEMLLELDVIAKAHHGPSVTTMKLVSAPKSADGLNRRCFKRIVGGLLLLSTILVFALAIALDEWSRYAVNAGISICETLRFGGTRTFDDFLRTVKKTMPANRTGTALALDDAIQRHTRRLEGESPRWLDDVITLLEARKADGQVLSKDAAFLDADAAARKHFQTASEKQDTRNCLRASKQVFALRQAALPASDPLIAHAVLSVADSLFVIDELDLATTAYQRYLTLSEIDRPSDDAVSRANAYLRLAEIESRRLQLGAAQDRVLACIQILVKNPHLSYNSCARVLNALIAIGRKVAPAQRNQFCEVWQPQVMSLYCLPRPRSKFADLVLTQFDLLRCQTCMDQKQLKQAEIVLRAVILRSGHDPSVTTEGRLVIEDYLVGLVDQSFSAGTQAQVQPLLQLAQRSANPQVRFIGMYAQVHYDAREHNWTALTNHAEKAVHELSVAGASHRGEDAWLAYYAAMAANSLGNFKDAENYLKKAQILGKSQGTLAATQALLGTVYLTSGRPARALQAYAEAHNMYDLHKLKRPMWLYGQWTEALQKLARNDEVDVVLTIQKEAVRQKLMED